MNTKKYHKEVDLVDKILEKRFASGFNQKKVRMILSEVAREDKFLERRIIILVRLLHYDLKDASMRDTYVLLSRLIVGIESVEETDTLSCILDTESNSVLMNMIWTQRYVMRIHFDEDENAHLNRLSELRMMKLSKPFEQALGFTLEKKVKRYPRQTRCACAA